MSRPSLETLHNTNHYTILATLSHDDLITFVQEAMRETSLITTLYWVLNAVMLLVTVFSWLGTPFFEGLSVFGTGIILGYLFIVPHEHLHGLAYRLLGATDVRIVYRWRQLTAYCVAHGFVVDKYPFWFVALLPFMVITLAVLGLWLVLPQYALVWSGVLFFHTAACSGDFALVNYFWKRRTQPLYTYDDADTKQSYFIRANAE